MKNAFRTEHEDEPGASSPSLLPRAYQDDAPTVPGTSSARGAILTAFREAVLELHGASGLADLAARLPADVRSATVDTAFGTMWMPETYVLAWYEALWSGPCAGNAEKFCGVLDRMLDRGFGRVRRTFLKLASPETILAKAPGLWRYDHTHGRLSTEVGAGVARVTLADHVYTESSLSCLAISEIYRYCASLTRVRQVTESHFRNGAGTLVVTLRWKG